MPSKESLERAIEEKLYKAMDVYSAGYMGNGAFISKAQLWEMVRPLLDEAIREARIDEHGATCHKALVELDKKGNYAKTLRCGKGWTCDRLAQLREGKP